MLGCHSTRRLVHCLQSKDIKVGDTLMVENKEELSCDVVLLATSDPEGTAYIETGTRCAAPWLCSRLACCALLTQIGNQQKFTRLLRLRVKFEIAPFFPANLDGETNLKRKAAIAATRGLLPETIGSTLKGEATCHNPQLPSHLVHSLRVGIFRCSAACSCSNSSLSAACQHS